MWEFKRLRHFVAAVASVGLFCVPEPALLAQSEADLPEVVTASSLRKRCRCGRWTCPSCQQQLLCEPYVAPQVPYQPQAIPQDPDRLDDPVAPEPSPSDTLDFSDATPTSPDAANLLAFNRSASSGGFFGSSLRGATAPEMMGDFFGGAPSVFDRGPTTFSVPVPTTSFTLGRMKQAENNTPVPTDRIFFNYSLFTDVPLATAPITVNRFAPGFEKTFLDGLASVELRLPFGTTLDNDILANGLSSNNDFQFGNLFMAVKGVLIERENWLLTAGTSITAPTADDISVIDPANGLAFLRIDNEATHVMPFLGGSFVPNDRFFAQWILQCDVDVNGNSVTLINGSVESNLGTAQDYTLLYTDISAGYWLYRSQCRCDDRLITGIATTVELHHNRSLNDADVVADANNRLVSTLPEFDVLNTQLGLIFNIRDRSRLAIGYATPMGNNNDRMFDNELRVTFNRYF